MSADSFESPHRFIDEGQNSGCVEGGCTCDRLPPGDHWLHSDTPALGFLRDRPLFGNVRFSAGGALRYRHMNERNRLRPLGSLRRTTYDLWRLTPFLRVGNDLIEGYVEAIDASIFNEDLPATPIDVNRSELLQYYVDLRLREFDDGSLQLRYGRQVLKYGTEHLVSPLPWANTFRNFEGFRLYYQGAAWDIDGFAVQPVHTPPFTRFRPRSFDTPDQSIWFSGVYATYKQLPTGPLDVYWLWLNEDEPKAALHDGRRHTVGARWEGAAPVTDCCGDIVRTWLWEMEGAWQFGEDTFQNGGANQDVSAGFLSLVAGMRLDRLSWTPTIKGVFWWGSGDDDPADGDINTVTTLFPLGHAHWGLIDNLNGGNLLDYSVQASVKPHERLTYLAAWHWFDKAQTSDHVYNVTGAPLGPLGTGRNIGHELDLVATYTVNANLSLQMGYFWFWYGQAVDETPLARPDAHQFYLMSTWGF